MKFLRSILQATVAATAIIMVPAASAHADKPLPVVATFSILGDMVENIGGEHIELTTLVGPNGDAHVFQPTPADAQAVAGAKVLIVNGLEFEGWLERLAEAASFEGDYVVATAGIDAIPYEEAHDEHGHDEHGHDEHGHDEHGHDEHGHDHGEFDPHAWQSVDHAMVYVDNIAAALAKADPANAAAYYENRATYVAKLEALDAEIRDMMASIPEDKRTIITSHDAFGYFAKAYGFQFLAPQGLSTESEASAADVARMITFIRKNGISAVFDETITDNRLLEQIASETGARIGGTLYSDTLSEEDGPAANYIDMIRHNVTTLVAVLTP